MSSSRQNPQVKAPFCLGAFVAAVAGSVVVLSSVVVDVLVLEVVGWLFRLRNLAVRAETLEMMLPVTDEASDEKVRMLAASNRLGASSDFTEEYVLEVRIDARSLTTERGFG